ncbi:MAG: hypothetical protein ACOX7C_01460 [Brevefilum sp.]|jgi:hypothetical protein
MSDENQERLRELELKISLLNENLEKAKAIVQQWRDKSARLSQNAAEERAKNQYMGRGLGGILFGSKYQASRRKEAALANALLARKVAEERAKILEGRQKAQQMVQEIQSELRETKEEHKNLKAILREQKSAKSSKETRAKNSIELLHKLKEIYELGLLTPEEYEEKRKKLVSDI